jgi:hypothetical protein
MPFSNGHDFLSLFLFFWLKGNFTLINEKYTNKRTRYPKYLSLIGLHYKLQQKNREIQILKDHPKNCFLPSPKDLR